MRRPVRSLRIALLTPALALLAVSSPRAEQKPVPAPPPKSQYAFAQIAVPAASAEEALRETFSLPAALDYIEQGAQAWTKERQCISCHTNGTYLLTRPALARSVGIDPASSLRDFFVDELARFAGQADREAMRTGITPTQIAYLAAGLAEWDRHLTEACSTETSAALSLLFDVQSEDGSFSNIDCWPPLESSAYSGATVAAMAAASAPGWLARIRRTDPTLSERYERLASYLRLTSPPHDYARVLLLWTATRAPSLLTRSRQDAIVTMIREAQRDDGGWSLRNFATPETWGGGNRAAKLRAEPDWENPPSDGHMTGLAVIVLREAGVAKTDPQIVQAVRWLKSNQRASGRWWTRSLNTDKHHFITYSGSCYPLLALALCEALPTAPTAR